MTTKITIQDMHKIAHLKGGSFLSEKYFGGHQKHLWRCSKGHTWEAKPCSIKSGTWCPYCIGRGKTIEDMRRLARNKKGLCLSDNYESADTKLKWQCEYGHIWEAIPYTIGRGHWCPICRNIKNNARMQERKPKIASIQELARKRDGKLLSMNYNNAHARLKWTCKEGHVWEASLHQLKTMKSWCPTCSTGISERICREFFEKIFSASFPRKKPNWLLNSRRNKMELDGYNKDLKLAFEYQGQQHYRKNKFFHRDMGAFNLRKKDDYLKKQLCKDAGVTLIDIPYKVTFEKMHGYIIEACKSSKINVPAVSKIDFTLLDAYVPERLREFEKIAESKGGKVISNRYYNAHTKLKWICKEGHVWEATPNHIKLDGWCPKCANIKKGAAKRFTIDELRNMAIEKGGKCLSEFYKPRTKIKWQCSKGHIWEAMPYQIKEQGNWCPKCGTLQTMEKRSMDYLPKLKERMFRELQEIARLRGGKIISDKYITAQRKFLWQCSKGHVWSAKPHNVKINHTWCPTCARSSRRKKE